MATLILLAFPVALVVAAITDLASMTIGNRLVVGLAVLFPLFALAVGWSSSAMALHGAVGLAMLLVTFGCFAAGWMGGGDAKLIAAVALWLGPNAELMSFLIWSSLYGGVLTIVFMLARASLSPTTGMLSIDRLLRKDTGIPYGVALAAGGLTVFPSLWASLPG